MSTNSQLRTQVNYRRRDNTDDFVTDAEITAYFNNGMKELTGDYDFDFTQASANLTYVDGTNSYVLSALGNGDFKSPIDIFYTDNYEFEYVSPEDFDRLSGDGNYNIYSKDGDYLKVKTTFGSATLAVNFYSYYMAKTSAGSWTENLSADDDEPLIPSRFQDILIDYALMRIFQKEGLTDDYGICKQDFDKKKYLLIKEYPSKRKHALNRIKHVTELGVAYNVYGAKEDPLENCS